MNYTEQTKRLDRQTLLRLYKRNEKEGLFGDLYRTYQKLLKKHMEELEKEIKKEMKELG